MNIFVAVYIRVSAGFPVGTGPRENTRECDGDHLALGLDAPHKSQMQRKSSRRRAGTMTMRRISTYTIDMVAVAAAVVLAAPFIAVMISPFLGGL